MDKGGRHQRHRGLIGYSGEDGREACGPVEDTISVLHLITHGIPSRYPQMKILNSHLGGALAV